MNKTDTQQEGNTPQTENIGSRKVIFERQHSVNNKPPVNPILTQKGTSTMKKGTEKKATNKSIDPTNQKKYEKN